MGADFLNAVDAAILRIEAAPDRWRKIETDVGRYLLRRFPYAVYYRILQGELRVLALKHHSRHPDYWKYRLSE